MAWKTIPQAPAYQAEHTGLIRYAKTKYIIPQVLERRASGKNVISLFIPPEGQAWFETGFLVASAFHGPPGPGQTLHHKDGDAMNNQKNNLEWV